MPPDQASDQTGVFEFAYADRQVERLGDQIDTARGQVEFESDPGIVSREFADDRREVKSSEVDRERNPEDSAGLFEHCAELLVRQPCLVHDPLASFKIELTGLGELYLARRAVQEPQADRLLQFTDTSREGGVRHAESLRSLAKAPGSGDLHEQCHVIQMTHMIAP